MFTPFSIAWIGDGTNCDLTAAEIVAGTVTPSALATDDEGVVASDGDCAFSLYLAYADGQTSGGTAIASTEQVVTIFSQNSVINAAGFAVVAMSAMFF